MSEKTDYTDLGPDVILQAIDACGVETSGRMLALNSYENRVYRVELEAGRPLVAKFYRPQRWSNEAILEEHAFAQEIADAEIPVVPPMVINGKTLLHFEGYRYALYPLQGGRWPELNQRDDLAWCGRFIARIHALGRQTEFRHRNTISITRMGIESSQYLLQSKFIPTYLEEAYQSLVEDLINNIEQCFERAGKFQTLRIHGDCHRGNILWTDNGPHFVDLDDCCTGPAVQDLWMLLAGDRNEMTDQLCDLLEGYNEFMEFDERELHLIEALRSLRMMHYAAWLARRWEDAAFPQAFPWFNTTRYWEDHVLELREQLSRMQEPVLVV
jgi:Ser/Thr protein kinase RdoA (MazF antagonist)